MLTALLLVATAFQTQAPKVEKSVVGIWVLKSVTIDGRDASKDAKELSALLVEHGGVEIGMTYKFRKDQGCKLNDLGAGYVYTSETRDLLIEHTPEDGKEISQTFDVKFDGNNMKLMFKQKEKGKVRGKNVAMIFAPEE